MGPSRFASLLPDDVVTIETRSFAMSALHPNESAYIKHAVAHRQIEFATGRACARRAMTLLGHPEVEIAVRDRAPLFPASLCGSITHTEGLCAAAVCRRGRICSIGIDAERAKALPEELVRLVLREEELHAIGTREVGNLLPILYFSMKESFYKAHHAAGGGFLNFTDVRASILTEGAFQVHVVGGCEPRRHELAGRYSIDEDFVRTAVAFWQPK